MMVLISSSDILGIGIWTSARSIDWCSRISSLTESATPMSRMVALTELSERALIVSAIAVMTSVLLIRSNSSKITISDAIVDRSWRARRTLSGVKAS